MAQAYTTKTKQQVLERTFEDIDGLNEQLENEREHLERLMYEQEIVTDLAPGAETVAEIDDWEIEKMVLTDLATMSEMEIERIENELNKNHKLIQAIHHDMFVEPK